MSILGTDAFRYSLASALSEARESVSLASAFITLPGIEWVLGHLAKSEASLRVLSRWNCEDLVAGVSDLEVYTALREEGARFYILLDLHAKITLVDDKALLLGSANITNAGLRLVPGGNREMGISIVPTSEDIRVVDSLFSEAVEISTDLYDEFRRHIVQLKSAAPPRVRPKWPPEIVTKLTKGPERLWVAELFWCDSPRRLLTSVGAGNADEQTVRHDLALLGISSNISGKVSEADLRAEFLRSRAWGWLITRLKNAHRQELYFGELTSLLHDALLDDPKPYRRDVKTLVINLVTWLAEVGQSSVRIDRPRHSQRLRLLS